MKKQPFKAKKYLNATLDDPKDFWIGVGIAISRKMPKKIKQVVPLVADLLELTKESIESLFTTHEEELKKGLFSFYDYYYHRMSDTYESQIWLDKLGEKRPLIRLLNLMGDDGIQLINEQIDDFLKPQKWTAERLANFGMKAYEKAEKLKK